MQHLTTRAFVSLLLGSVKNDQELLRLLTWEELSHEQVATVLGITPNAVAPRCSSSAT